MVARKVCTSASVSPMPESSTWIPPLTPVRIRICAGAEASSWRRAVMASTAFCISSRRYTFGEE